MRKPRFKTKEEFEQWRKEHCRKIGKHFKKGMIPWNKGIKRTDILGEKHGRWKGGISKTKEYHLMKNEEWRKKNPEKWRRNQQVQKHRRRALGTINSKVIQMLYEDNIKKYGTLTCLYCKKNIEFGKDHLEHKIPISRGGTNIYENLGIACSKCNLEKGNKTEEEYKERKGKKWERIKWCRHLKHLQEERELFRSRVRLSKALHKPLQI